MCTSHMEVEAGVLTNSWLNMQLQRLWLDIGQSATCRLDFGFLLPFRIKRITAAVRKCSLAIACRLDMQVGA